MYDSSASAIPTGGDQHVLTVRINGTKEPALAVGQFVVAVTTGDTTGYIRSEDAVACALLTDVSKSAGWGDDCAFGVWGKSTKKETVQFHDQARLLGVVRTARVCKHPDYTLEVDVAFSGVAAVNNVFGIAELEGRELYLARRCITGENIANWIPVLGGTSEAQGAGALVFVGLITSDAEVPPDFEENTGLAAWKVAVERHAKGRHYGPQHRMVVELNPNPRVISGRITNSGARAVAPRAAGGAVQLGGSVGHASVSNVVDPLPLTAPLSSKPLPVEADVAAAAPAKKSRKSSAAASNLDFDLGI